MGEVRQKKTETTVITYVSDIQCDLCGESCRFDFGDDSETYNLNYAVVTTSFGYGSKQDFAMSLGIPTKMYLCEDCWIKLFGKTWDARAEKHMDDMYEQGQLIKTDPGEDI